MNPIVGISGIRGVIEKTFSVREVQDYAMSFGSMFPKDSNIAVARDSRITGFMLKNAVISGLLSVGCNVIDLDMVPTPTLQFYVRNKGLAGGIIITASHNPIKWNALKFYKKNGKLIDKKDIEKLKEIYKTKNFKIKTYDKIGIYREDDSVFSLHINEVLKNLYNLKEIKKRRFKVVIDSCNGAGSFITPEFLKKLNCEVISIYTNPDGYFPRGAEPIPSNLNDLAEKVKKTKAHIGFAQDPDADRLAIVNEKGEPIGEELTLALATKYMLYREKGDLVCNLSTSKVMEDIAEGFGVRLYRTPVGEMNVAKMLISKNALIGGEGNGGVIYPPINYGRDSLVGIGFVLGLLALENKDVSELVDEFKKYTMIKDKVTYIKKTMPYEKILKFIQKNYKIIKISRIDGLYIKTERFWAHIRPSNTEPIFRVIVEGEDKNFTLNIVKKIKEILKK